MTKKRFKQKNGKMKITKRKMKGSGKSKDDNAKNAKRYNEEFASILSELNGFMTKKSEFFKARAYKSAEETILGYPSDIICPEQLKGLPGIGEAVINKLREHVNTGKVKYLEQERNDPINVLTNVYGIGFKKAQSLIEEGIDNIEKLKENKSKLNNVQQIGLQYYEPLLERISRKEIDEYKKKMEIIFKTLPNHEDATFEIVGSYRRGAESSGDIDVIITSVSNDKSIFEQFLNKLEQEKVILEFLSKGKIKSLTIGKLDDESIPRRLDFLYATPSEYPFSILYFTGSKAFNTVMRQRALTMGYTLNEHGIHKMENKKKGDKVTNDFKNEEDIFNFFKMEYKSPTERKSGKAVVEKNTTNLSPIIVTTIPQTVSDKKTLKIEKKSQIDKKINKKTRKMTKPTVLKHIEKYKKDGISYIENQSIDVISQMVKHSIDYYFKDTPLMEDNTYDIMKEYLQCKDPENPSLFITGAEIKGKSKVKLPYYMGSMDKIKPTSDALIRWLKKYSGSYVISAKLDGVSGLYTTEGDEPKLYTRGDGKEGQDISHVIKYLKLPSEKNIVIRGEFIIGKNVFNEKYGKDFKNPRNFIAGLLNTKSPDNSKLSNIDFVAYEVIKPEVTPLEQMKLLESMNVKYVKNCNETMINNEMLSKILTEWRSSYDYEIDGIIVTNNKIYNRENKNPDHSFAFKMVFTDQIAETWVTDVIWSASKDGYLKPKIRIQPINLGGVTIEYATAFNASFVEQHKLGLGASVEIIRSGDVIPYIKNVLKPAETVIMPEEDYYWNDTHVDIILKNKNDNETVLMKNITLFFTTIGVKQVSQGNVKKMMKSGFRTIPKILQMTKDDFLKVDGFKDKSATTIYTGIKEQVEKASMAKLMTASNIFGHGFGEKKFDLILKEYPSILTSNETKEEKTKKLASVKGMAEKTAKQFVEQIDEFLDYLNETKLNDKLQQNEEQAVLNAAEPPQYDTSNVLYKQKIVMTGFRNPSLELILKQKYDMSISSSVNKKVLAILVKSKDESNKKTETAQSLGIPIMTQEEFMQKYLQDI